MEDERLLERDAVHIEAPGLPGLWIPLDGMSAYDQANAAAREREPWVEQQQRNARERP